MKALCSITTDTTFGDLFIMNAYAPTEKNYDTKMVIGDLNVKPGRGDIHKMDTGKCGLHFETNNNTTLLILQYARV
jgi:hypothetical protein